MKKFLILLLISLVSILSASAVDLPDMRYNIIHNKQKIAYTEQGLWTLKSNKKMQNYFIKTSDLFNKESLYLDSNKNLAFTTGCDYELFAEGKLIGYSNDNLKFYELDYKNGELIKSELTEEEVRFLFPGYELIKLSEFRSTTNSLKLKKKLGELKIILYNDTDNTYENYTFTSGNSTFKQYDMRGFLSIQKSGMIQFSENDNKSLPWYVLLIR